MRLNNSIWIYDFDNYRLFLRSLYLQLKTVDPKYSFRYIARCAGYKSASAIQDVINGKKNLSIDGANRFARAFKLNANETKFFKSLVMFNQSTEPDSKIRFAKELSDLRINKNIAALKENQYRLFENWYYPAIAEIVAIDGFREDYKWIAEQVIPAITEHQARDAVEMLIKLDILIRDKDNNLKPKDMHVSTPNEVYSAYVAHWHRECMKKAAESIDTVPRDERDISGTYFAVSKSAIPKVKEIIHRFQKEILELASHEDKKEAVYQLGVQLFPLVRSQNGRSSE